MYVLGIESSCDETAAAILRDGTTLLAHVVDSQIDMHSRYGGVVPELASRRHLETIYPVVQETMARAGINFRQLHGIAVTQGPGLIGSLLIGFSFAKALAMASGLPLVGVDHLAGHLLSVFLGDRHPAFPFIALVASGGHSSLYQVDDPFIFHLLGRSRDDAAGEAFDKVAKLLNLGYPGGPIISRYAEQGDKKALPFPRAWLAPDSLDFSFSGLKTAVVNHVTQLNMPVGDMPIADICASFQEAVVEVLTEKAIRAAQLRKINRLVLAGGVAANDRLREYLQVRGREENIDIFLVPLEFCTDNAAMTALAGTHLLRRGDLVENVADVYSRSAKQPLPLKRL
jgi:N6-L-threonylcarbamoyladenine synthase